jgi:hypothetical protein
MILMKSRRLMGRALSLMITAYHIVDGGFCATAKIRPRLPKRVNRDWAGQAAGPAMSGMPR